MYIRVNSLKINDLFIFFYLFIFCCFGKDGTFQLNLDVLKIQTLEQITFK